MSTDQKTIYRSWIKDKISPFMRQSLLVHFPKTTGSCDIVTVTITSASFSASCTLENAFAPISLASFPAFSMDLLHILTFKILSVLTRNIFMQISRGPYRNGLVKMDVHDRTPSYWVIVTNQSNLQWSHNNFKSFRTKYIDNRMICCCFEMIWNGFKLIGVTLCKYIKQIQFFNDFIKAEQP